MTKSKLIQPSNFVKTSKWMRLLAIHAITYYSGLNTHRIEWRLVETIFRILPKQFIRATISTVLKERRFRAAFACLLCVRSTYCAISASSISTNLEKKLKTKPDHSHPKRTKLIEPMEMNFSLTLRLPSCPGDQWYSHKSQTHRLTWKILSDGVIRSFLSGRHFSLKSKNKQNKNSFTWVSCR